MPPPRILLVMPEHWPRALLRAELIERGYDVVGTPDLPAALLSRPVEKDRGPVRVIVVDQDVLVEPQSRLLDLLASRHPNARLVLLGRAQLETPPGDWDQILRRPALIGEIASAVEQAVTEPPTAAAPRT
jgi:hypothetical protein